MTIFEQWWIPIEQLMNEKVPLNIFQSVYKEIYVNAIRDNRWLLYLNGLWVTLQVSFFAILLGTLLGTLLAVLRLPDVTDLTYRGKNPLKKAGMALLKFFCGFAKFYIDLIRGTPLLLQVLIINFGISARSALTRLLSA